MQTEQKKEKTEAEWLKQLQEMEDLASKKAGVYSRLLIDAQLAQKMEGLEKRHKERKLALENLLYDKSKNEKTAGQVRGEEK